MEKIIIITGYTASGKTNLSLKLAKKFNGEIINADSVIFYKYLNIGSAKPTQEELNEAKHHLINVIEPNCDFSAYDFYNKADELIKDLSKRKKLPIIVGGSPLYIKSLIKGFFELDNKNKKLELQIRKKLINKDNQELYKELMEKDEESSKNIHINDKKRIIRALEVFYSTGKKLSEYQKEHNFKKDRYKYLKIARKISREEIYKKINQRVDLMIAAGLVKEVEKLIEMGFKDTKALTSIGYKEIISFLENKITIEEAIDKIKQHSRNFAKRQNTWFKKEKDIHYFDNDNEAFNLIEEFFKNEQI